MYGSVLPANNTAAEIPLVEAAPPAPLVQVIATKEDAPSTSATPPPAKKERDMLWDNAKLILTCFVVMGHMLSEGMIYPCYYIPRAYCDDYGPAYAFYSWFHMFEMPGFIFISGYFSRSFVTVKDKTEYCTSTAKLKGNLTKIFFVFLSFTIWSSVFNAHDKVHVMYRVKHGQPTQGNFSWTPFFDLRSTYHYLFPQGITNHRFIIWDKTGRVPPVWYMFSLFLWRLSVPYFKIFKRPILVAFSTAFIAAYINWQETLIARTFGYLPFFILGLCVSKEYVDLLRVHRVQYLCTAYLFGMFFVVLYNTEFFFKYVAMVPASFRAWSDHWECIFYYFFTVSMTFAYFGFVSMTLSTYKGLAINAQNTLYNYLLHYPIIMATSWFWDWGTFLRDLNPWVQCLFTMGCAVCIGVVTTTQVTIPLINHKLHLFQAIISPNVLWLFEGSEDVTLENCMGDASGYCTGHFGLGYVWSVLYKHVGQNFVYYYRNVNRRLFAQENKYAPGRSWAQQSI